MGETGEREREREWVRVVSSLILFAVTEAGATQLTVAVASWVHYVDGEGGDPLAPVLHHLALCGRGVGGGEGRGAQ